MYAHVPYDGRCLAAILRLALCAVFLRSLRVVSSLHIYRHMPSYILLPSCAILASCPPSFLIPWNRNKSTSSQSLLHDIMVREKSVIILFCCNEFYVSEFYCIR